ncbi:inositol hexakisphosphate-domain-containing protein [Auriculariales sp. MPI-PUGE-AT-0066]|nr:inositol hexakisphosphate-domain-containing protein [Auriculariales sp. MPI-PUGE-AT-0066]
MSAALAWLSASHSCWSRASCFQMASPPPRSFSSTARLSHQRVSSLSQSSSQELGRQITRTPSRNITLDSTAASIDYTVQLTRAAPGIVKTRVGSVLSRGFVLKTDFHRTHDHLDISLHGAPNFRSVKGACAALNVHGAAQPRLVGLKGILSLLRCRPNSQSNSRCAWFSTREEAVVYIGGRPFVLRDAADPRNTLQLADRAESLEAIEARLKDDVLAEAAKFDGLILTHNENAEQDGTILPMWTPVEETSVCTPKEIWEGLRQQGWKLDYYRIPITQSRRIEDNYLDSYVRVIQDMDPLTTSLVFSCGAGAVRTTYAMCAATLFRRKQIIEKGLEDPFMLMRQGNGAGSPTGGSSPAGANAQAAVVLEHVNAQNEFSRSLLKLAALLQQSLSSNSPQNAIEILLTLPPLMDSLRKALLGNYGVVLSLIGCIDNGLETKRVVDEAVDLCDQVVNLREVILSHRVSYTLTSLDDKQGEEILDRAQQALEKYFSMIAFASYVETRKGKDETFSQWMTARVEIWNQVMFLRKSSGSRLNVFAPVNDLSSVSATGAEFQIWGPRSVNLSGGATMGDEWTAHVLNNRSGIVLRANTLLKSDQWRSQQHQMELNIRGVINLRNVPGSTIYCAGQPTLEAIDNVIKCIKERHPDAKQITWITLREEPLVYVNGSPYCLRRESFSLRNMKDYGGISGSRLEVLEERLKADVLAELQSFGGSILLHTENAKGEVVSVWEEVRGEGAVQSLKDIMESRKHSHGVELQFARVPITAERAPDPVDISELLELMMRLDEGTPIVLNCQLGRGRSTMASIVLLLAQQWLQNSRIPSTPGKTKQPGFSRTLAAYPFPESDEIPQQRSYQAINNLLRVIRRGLSVKLAVDNAIDACSAMYNLREAIEDSRVRAEEASDEKDRKAQHYRGIHNLRRYFQLVEFQAYLQATRPGMLQDHETFPAFLKQHPVFQTFEHEMLAQGPAALKPLERVSVSDGVAFPDEAKQLVANRSGKTCPGSILSASTILKSDFFSGLQKMSLPERIEGAPNFRRLPLKLGEEVDKNHNVCGCGMPTVDGLRRALKRVNADPDGSNTVYWTSLREEPVLYVSGRPHVLRLVDKPLVNVEQKGVTTAVVERMEKSLKYDLIRELTAANGRVLVHDEIEDPPGSFTITAIWETIAESDVMTPRDVFELMRSEGYRVNYGRVAITDEQAPLPVALGEIFERVKQGVKDAGDLVFNCQMGRGRTTSGMVVASLVSTILELPKGWEAVEQDEPEEDADLYDLIEGFSDEQVYLSGEYKTILQLVGVLSNGKVAKRMTDAAMDAMQDVQNLRKAIYDYKLKAEASAPGSAKHKTMTAVGVNYLYRYGTIIAFANYLLEVNSRETRSFADWLTEHREIMRTLERSSLD